MMQTHRLGLAALLAATLLAATPVSAQSSGAFSGSANGGSGLHSPSGQSGSEGWRDGGTADIRDGRRYRRDRRHGWGGGYVYYGGEWALYNNRSFEPESYNDWWHERPNRSLPRWTQRNRNCERVWWSGEGWTC